MIDIGAAIYGVILLTVALWLYRAHNDPKTKLDLKDLIKENGRLSKIAIAFLTTLFTSSWYVVHEAIQGQLTDLAFGAYLTAWVAPIVAHVLKGTPTGRKR